jgi:NhaD family Na+/H+ antiporter
MKKNWMSIYMSEFLSNQFIILLFIIGYLGIIFEFHLKVNKTAVALVMAVLCWGFYFVCDDVPLTKNLSELSHHLSDISQIVLFLLGAMTLVELIDSHRGFLIVNRFVKTRSKKMMIVLVGFTAFFLSSILDNLTTTILMISILRKLIPDQKERISLACLVIIAANAGGAWTPIGDVTTTMLWINDKISTEKIISYLFVPSMVSLLIPMLFFVLTSKGNYAINAEKIEMKYEPHARLVLIAGILALVLVPVIKYFTGLPPFMGMLIALGVLWLVTDALHHKYETRNHLRVPYVLTKIDTSNVLFFLGILLAVDALQAVNLLNKLAGVLDSTIGNLNWIATVIGLFSAVIDNVPLVAAAMGMYDVSAFPMNHPFWLLLAFAAGTGGSILIIGSSAGVAVMGMEKIDFFTYVKKAFIPAILGYFAGILVLIYSF